MTKTAYLVLENGKVFTGTGFGFEGEATGEIVFSTGMIGYLENLTDPNYLGQMVVQTFPSIGNYGFIPQDVANEKPVLSAYIIKELCQEPSNFRSQGVLDTFLKQCKVPGIMGIDTRELTKIIRNQGTMNAKLCLEKPDTDKICAELKAMKLQNSVANIAKQETKTYTPETILYNVAVWDFGVRHCVVEALLAKGCKVTLVNADTTAEQISKMNFDGIVLSNGAGDPAENTAIISEIFKLCDKKIPMLAIDLGHQMLAIAQGATTKKLKHGHHGNQPVKDVFSQRVYITSQNHDYAVKTTTLPTTAVECFVNANDNTCEGVRYTNMPALSVQFNPTCGPQEAGFVLDKFIDLIEEGKANAVK